VGYVAQDREIQTDWVNWIQVAQDRVQWQVFVNTILNCSCYVMLYYFDTGGSLAYICYTDAANFDFHNPLKMEEVRSSETLVCSTSLHVVTSILCCSFRSIRMMMMMKERKKERKKRKEKQPNQLCDTNI